MLRRDNDTSENYDGVVGKALLERRTGINGTCKNMNVVLWIVYIVIIATIE